MTTVIDDPLKPKEALSKAQRQACNEWFVHTLYSRLNDKRSGVIIIIMQRCTKTTWSVTSSSRSPGKC